MAVVAAPGAFAIWMAKWPTPPAPPWMRTFLPWETIPRSRRACNAAQPAGNDVASAKSKTRASERRPLASRSRFGIAAASLWIAVRYDLVACLELTGADYELIKGPIERFLNVKNG